MKYLSVAILACCICAGASAGEVLSNTDVIDMVRAGLSGNLIVSKIQSSGGTFDLSSRALILLKENGAGDDVIAAMMQAAGSGAHAVDRARYDREMANIAAGSSDRELGLAWMLANKDSVLQLLRQSLADQNADRRSAAVIALGRMDDRSSVPSIRSLITDPSVQVRTSAARALADFGDDATINAAEQAVVRQVSPADGYIRLLGHARLTRTLPAIAAMLTSGREAPARAAAAWAIGVMGRPGGAEQTRLEQALTGDTDPDVRREAAAAVAAMHAPSSAPVLENACRMDPQVRRVTLAAMAEYPESVSFLVGVMNLGADQIAADELETARASLVRLTGQDFGIDGMRWNSWFAANSTRYPAAVAAAPAQEPAPLPYEPPAEVDMEAWSLVADANAIPMAPEADRALGASTAAPGLPAALLGPGAAPRGGPMSLSATDFADTPIPESDSFARSAPPPASMPAPPSEQSFFSTATTPEQPVLRTWSSEPAAPVPAQTAVAPAAPVAAPADEGMFAVPSSAFMADSQQDPFSAPAPAPAPVAAPRVDTSTMGGLSLPLPGMGAPAPAPATAQAAPAAPPADPFAGFSEGFEPVAAPVFESASSISQTVNSAVQSVDSAASQPLFEAAHVPSFEGAPAPDMLTAVPAPLDGEEISYEQFVTTTSNQTPSTLFVEPQPGQIVVGSPVFAPSAGAADSSANLPAEPVIADEQPLRLPPPGTPMVDLRYIQVQEAGEDRRAQTAAAQRLEQIYEPYAGQVVPEPPAPPPPPEPPAAPEQPYLRADGTPVPPGSDAFTDMSVPLPPVRDTGTISAGAKGELPTLGQGMF